MSVERTPDRWVDYHFFPAAETSDQVLHVGAAGSGASLQLKPGRPGTVQLTSAKQTTDILSATLTSPLRLSGTVRVTVGIRTSTAENIRVEAELFDAGPAVARGSSNRDERGILNPRKTKTCWGESTPGDSACFYDTPPDIVHVTRLMIGYGARDLDHYSSVTAVQTVRVGQIYTLHIPSYTMDRIVPAGHEPDLQIGAYGPQDSTTSIELSGTQMVLPVVGGVIPLAR